ncbi:MAG: hypothetical protein ABSB10_07445 [Candidatus Bathyarchaeia archaeon]|jgi:hypothetical protein
MVTEIELYPPVEFLFKDDYFMGKEIELGSKKIDLVCVNKYTGKVVAIEFKVKNWKKAIRQAWTYKACANESYIAIPEDRLSLIDQKILASLGLGVISIPNSGPARIFIAAPSSESISENSNTLIRASIVTQSAATVVDRTQRSGSFEYYLWYNAQDLQFYQDFTNVYNGFMVNAHTLAHYQSAFSALCLSLNKPFFVIPDTHFFQHASPRYFFDDEGELRTSWKKLLDEYEGITKEAIIDGRNLLASDFDFSTTKGQKNIKQLAEKVISNQIKKFNQAVEGLSFLSDIDGEKPKQNLVAPYFHLTSQFDPWYSVNLQAVKEAIPFKEDGALFALLCVEKDALTDNNFIDKIRQDYLQLDIDGFLIWLADFDEASETIGILQGFRNFIQMLSSTGKKVIDLYGGYYAILLRHFGLTGFSSGICTKDSADPENFPTGGPPGGPNPRYYFPLFKVKMDRAESRVSLSMNPQIACNCSVCTAELNQILDPATPKAVARQAMRQHFMNCRNSELQRLSSQTLNQDINELQQTFNKYANTSGIQLYTLPPIVQLSRWQHTIQS